MRDFVRVALLTILSATSNLVEANAEREENGRIKALFTEFTDFNEELLVKAFDEKSEAEFLLSETEDLIDELVSEFPDWIEKSQIGEATHEGRYIELV